MFIDHVQLEIRAGKGGNGAISFLRLKYMEHGGPDGGGGGRGGSIYFVASRSETTLYTFKYQKKIIAHDGENGGARDRYGKSAEDVYVHVPVGTMVYDAHTGELLADLIEENTPVLLAKGGRGGRGNATFKSSVNRAPRIAQNGDLGEKRTLRLELKLLADVGLVGFPSVGKSSLLTTVSNAKPAIADYEFTTLAPHLGVIRRAEENPYIMADLPGLIEGASHGKGLGLQFLRHIERCRVIVHVIDMASHRDPLEAYQQINHELESFSPALLTRPTLIVASKMDEAGAQDRLKKLQKQLKNKTIYPISLLSEEGVDALMKAIDQTLASAPMVILAPVESTTERIYTFKPKTPFEILRPSEHLFVLTGDELEETYRKMNTTTDQGLLSLFRYLRELRVEEALEARGIQEGDTVRLADFEFTYHGS
jgi:GTP-binding protein